MSEKLQDCDETRKQRAVDTDAVVHSIIVNEYGLKSQQIVDIEGVSKVSIHIILYSTIQ